MPAPAAPLHRGRTRHSRRGPRARGPTGKPEPGEVPRRRRARRRDSGRVRPRQDKRHTMYATPYRILPSRSLPPKSHAQRRLERPQPRIEVTPLIDAFLEDRPAHLLGARGSYAAFGLVELHAPRFEFKFAEIKHPAHVRLQILDHVLVLDAQHLPRQHSDRKST